MGVPVDPAAADELAAVLAEMLEEPQNLSSVRDIDTAVGSVRTLRVGYVGELGWELHAANDQLVALYEASELSMEQVAPIWRAGIRALLRP